MDNLIANVIIRKLYDNIGFNVTFDSMVTELGYEVIDFETEKRANSKTSMYLCGRYIESKETFCSSVANHTAVSEDSKMIPVCKKHLCKLPLKVGSFSPVPRDNIKYHVENRRTGSQVRKVAKVTSFPKPVIVETPDDDHDL